MAARVGGVALLNFPSDWDTLMYHLPLVDQWLRAGSLYAPDDPVWYNAANVELVGLWCVGPFSGDFLTGLTNLPALVLFAGAAVELGGELGLGRRLSHVAGLAVVSNWVVFRQSPDAKNDMAVAALFLATLLFGMRYLRLSQRGALVYAACAFGLLCGVKYYAVGYAGGRTARVGGGGQRGPSVPSRLAHLGFGADRRRRADPRRADRSRRAGATDAGGSGPLWVSG